MTAPTLKDLKVGQVVVAKFHGNSGITCEVEIVEIKTGIYPLICLVPRNIAYGTRAEKTYLNGKLPAFKLAQHRMFRLAVSEIKQILIGVEW